MQNVQSLLISGGIMSRKKFKESRDKRISGGYFAFPEMVYKSRAYRDLSSVGRDLFMFVCSQYNGSNNGDLTCTFLGANNPDGWNLRVSKSTFNRALRNLLEGELLMKTVQGGRHKASRFAIATHGIDDIDGMELAKPTRKAVARFLKHENKSAGTAMTL